MNFKAIMTTLFMMASLVSFAGREETFIISVDKLMMEETGDFDYTGGAGDLIIALEIDKKTYPFNLNTIQLEDGEYLDSAQRLSLILPASLFSGDKVRFKFVVYDRDLASISKELVSKDVILNKETLELKNEFRKINGTDYLSYRVTKRIELTDSVELTEEFLNEKLKVKNLRFRLSNIEVYGVLEYNSQELAFSYGKMEELLALRSEIIKLHNIVKSDVEYKSLADEFNSKMLNFADLWPLGSEISDYTVE